MLRSMRSVFDRLGLDRPELRAWGMYDWANSPFMTSVVASVFPIYFSSVAAEQLPAAVATRRFALTSALALVTLALCAPLLGALADRLAIRKRLLAAFLSLGAGTTACMFFVGRGDWLLAAVLFGLANIGAYGSFVFYDSLLPHVARRDEVDRVSTGAYALGYLGGGLLLLVHLLWIRYPGAFGWADADTAARAAFVSVAVWWLLFSLPLLRRVREPGPERRGEVAPLRDAWLQLRQTLRELRRYRHAIVFLIAFLLYSDGIGTIIRLAAIYGMEIGIARDTLLVVILLVQFVSVPFTFLFGRLALRIGAKAGIFLGLAVYVGICAFAYTIRSGSDFLVLALLVGTVQGGTQALSRSLFASLIPRSQSAQFFSFFAIVERFGGFIGPSLFVAVGAATGSNRNAILALVGLFVAGGVILAFVDVREGRRCAEASESAAD